MGCFWGQWQWLQGPNPESCQPNGCLEPPHRDHQGPPVTTWAICWSRLRFGKSMDKQYELCTKNMSWILILLISCLFDYLRIRASSLQVQWTGKSTFSSIFHDYIHLASFIRPFTSWSSLKVTGAALAITQQMARCQRAMAWIAMIHKTTLARLWGVNEVITKWMRRWSSRSE